MLYESALVGAFNYLWGHADASARKPPSMPILSNAQNPLDHLLGDMIGRVEGRYFLISSKLPRPVFLMRYMPRMQSQLEQNCTSI